LVGWLLLALAVQDFVEYLISNHLFSALIWHAGFFSLLLFKHSFVVLLPLKFLFLQFVLMISNLK